MIRKMSSSIDEFFGSGKVQGLRGEWKIPILADFCRTRLALCFLPLKYNMMEGCRLYIEYGKPPTEACGVFLLRKKGIFVTHYCVAN